MKPKTNQKGNVAVSQKMDRCQTPQYALTPIAQYITQFDIVWEPAAGDGQLAGGIWKIGVGVIASDIIDNCNFFEWQPLEWDAIVTNPPYSIKYLWLNRCYSLNKPFALLMPIETIGAAKAQRLFDKYGVEIVFTNQRTNFNMPDKGYAGTAQFPTCWFTYGFNIGKQITFDTINNKILDKDWSV